MKPTFNAVVTPQGINIHDITSFKRYIQTTYKNGEAVSVTVSRTKNPRSLNQNAYYWGVVLPVIGKNIGYTTNETHDALKDMFLTDRTGRIPRVKSTTTMSTSEFEEYVATVRTWAYAELNITVPLPNNIESFDVF